MNESELFEPVKNHFTSKGYDVDGEVENCDLVAIKNDNIVIVELKKTFSLKLVMQGIDRQELSKEVYLAVPKEKYNSYKDKESQTKICKRLGLGLIHINTLKKDIDILLEPRMKISIYKYREERLLYEFRNRGVKKSTGGVVSGAYSAYYQRCIQLACILEVEKQMSAVQIREKYNTGFTTYNILYNNHYGWFQKVDKGIYALSEAGYDEIHNINNKDIYEHYRL